VRSRFPLSIVVYFYIALVNQLLARAQRPGEHSAVDSRLISRVPGETLTGLTIAEGAQMVLGHESSFAYDEIRRNAKDF